MNSNPSCSFQHSLDVLYILQLGLTSESEDSSVSRGRPPPPPGGRPLPTAFLPLLAGLVAAATAGDFADLFPAAGEVGLAGLTAASSGSPSESALKYWPKMQ